MHTKTKIILSSFHHKVSVSCVKFHRTIPSHKRPSVRSAIHVLINVLIRGNGWLADVYRESPKMPTYLLAFIVCDFAYKEQNTSDGRTRVGVVPILLSFFLQTHRHVTKISLLEDLYYFSFSIQFPRFSCSKKMGNFSINISLTI